MVHLSSGRERTSVTTLWQNPPYPSRPNVLNFLNRLNTYEDPQQWSNFEKLRFLVEKIFTQKYHHFGVKFPTNYWIVTPYWTLPVKVINGLFLRTLHFSDYPIVSTHRNQNLRRGFLLVRYPLKRPLSVELDVAIDLSSTFQRSFFHWSKYLTDNWLMDEEKMEPSGLFVRSCENLFRQIWFAAGLWSLPQEVAAVHGRWSFKWHLGGRHIATSENNRSLPLI